MNIAICEDTSADSERLGDYIREYCDAHAYLAKIRFFTSGEALLEAVRPGKFDLYFLDIILPGLSGVEAARQIRAIDRDCFLVFVTVSRDYTPEGFEVAAAGYVLKPVNREKLTLAMHNCRSVFERNSRKLEIPYQGETLKISVADLLFVEVYDKESVFHMKRGNIITRLPLGEVSELLGGAPFLRCHRSYIVNLNYVVDMRKDCFVIRSGDLVPIRKNGRREVRIALAEFIAEPVFEVS